MSLIETHSRLPIPESLRAQLGAFRRQVRGVKMIEAAGAAVCVVMVAFLILFAIDRLTAAPSGLRLTLFLTAVAGLFLVPWAGYRWIWGSRRFEQLARILGTTRPMVGDRLLGVIELSQSDSEQARSRRLCEAAIVQVAEDVRSHDFRQDVPNPRHRLWTVLAAVPLTVAIGLLIGFPAAAVNAWSRLVVPWSATPRYTFAVTEPLPSRLIVPHGEPFTLPISLAQDSVWRPATATARLGANHTMTAALRGPLHVFLPGAGCPRPARDPRRRRPPRPPRRADGSTGIDRRHRPGQAA